MTFQETWLPFIYLYGVGGLAFFLGLILIIKTKALRLDYFKHKKWLGFFFTDYFSICLSTLCLFI